MALDDPTLVSAYQAFGAASLFTDKAQAQQRIKAEEKKQDEDRRLGETIREFVEAARKVEEERLAEEYKVPLRLPAGAYAPERKVGVEVSDEEAARSA